MKLFTIIILSSFSMLALGNSPAQKHSDAFHGSSFGPTFNKVQQERQETRDAPSWTRSMTPEQQRMEEVPSERVNEWQEQSKRSKESGSL